MVLGQLISTECAKSIYYAVGWAGRTNFSSPNQQTAPVSPGTLPSGCESVHGLTQHTFPHLSPAVKAWVRVGEECLLTLPTKRRKESGQFAVSWGKALEIETVLDSGIDVSE